MYAERANKLNEEKEREEREGKRLVPDRIRLVPARAPESAARQRQRPRPGPRTPGQAGASVPLCYTARHTSSTLRSVLSLNNLNKIFED